MTQNNGLSVGMIYESVVQAKVTRQCDVIVAGGGTAGCVAAIAAARAGSEVLLIERRGYLGGMLTAGNAGMTSYIVYDKRQAEHLELIENLKTNPASIQIAGGIPMEIARRLLDRGAASGTYNQAGAYLFSEPVEFKHLLLEMMEEAGVNVLLHSMIVNVVKEANNLKGIVLESKNGREIILARQYIDCTGDGDVAALAGAPYVVGVGPNDLAAQMGKIGVQYAMGAMFRLCNIDMEKTFHFLKQNPQHFHVQSVSVMDLERSWQSFRQGEMTCFLIVGIGHDHDIQINNSPIPGVFTFCCPIYEGDGLSNRGLTTAELEMERMIRDCFQQMKQRLPGFENAFLLDIPEIGVRETRHVQGEYVLTIKDVFSVKEFDDSIGLGSHPIDVRPIPEELRQHRLPPRWSFTIPYRCLVPLQVDNLLVAGRCISATHEASGCTRPTVQCMVTGEAAGTAAAMCVQEKINPRYLDVKGLQDKLTLQGVKLGERDNTYV